MGAVGKGEDRLIALSVQAQNVLDGKGQVVLEVEMREW